MGDDTRTRLPRKHSSGDLQSRLKTRKLLGVGVTDDGDVHRSKLSQILGHSEQLYVKVPRGLRIWQVVMVLMFSCMGLWALIFPKNLFAFALNQEAGDSTVLPTRLYGAALVSIAVIFWSTVQSTDREVIRWSLLSCAFYFIIQIIVLLTSSLSLLTWPGLLSLIVTMVFVCPNVFFYHKMITSITLIELGSLYQMAPRIIPHRVISAAISLYYYQVMGVSPVKPRRSFHLQGDEQSVSQNDECQIPSSRVPKNKDD